MTALFILGGWFFCGLVKFSWILLKYGCAAIYFLLYFLYNCIKKLVLGIISLVNKIRAHILAKKIQKDILALSEN